MNTRAVPHDVEALQIRARENAQQQVEQLNDWERALHREWVSLLSRNAISFPYPMEGTLEDGTPTSGSIQTAPAFQAWNSNTLSRGTVLQRDRLRGRTRMVITGEVIPEVEEPQVSAINVGTLKATTSDEDKYCMLDSGANVMVVPLMRDMKGDKTTCSLVGDNKTQGLIISRLYTETRTYLVVAVRMPQFYCHQHTWFV